MPTSIEAVTEEEEKLATSKQVEVEPGVDYQQLLSSAIASCWLLEYCYHHLRHW